MFKKINSRAKQLDLAFVASTTTAAAAVADLLISLALESNEDFKCNLLNTILRQIVSKLGELRDEILRAVPKFINSFAAYGHYTDARYNHDAADDDN